MKQTSEHADSLILSKLPAHLLQFVKPQIYDEYSAIDQAVWRYVMRTNVEHLSKIAHHSYLDGLARSGISIDQIPDMLSMNQILADIGWAVVSVDGFIPPSAFMEFQAYNVLVIASDIRQLEHIEYTPAPDIIHEGAGHAPIIANPEYAEYIRRFGEVGCKAIGSEKDYQLYEAVRHLSIIKEAPGTTEAEIQTAEKRLEELQDKMGEPSEMALIRNLHWWTVEYGLVGTDEELKIYGAGLLSSIGESRSCMTDAVKKRPYTIDAARVNFDITKPQPQLFVTPDFAHLSLVLEEFANTMALRKGGLPGLKKLIDSKNLGSIELSTGLQISGTFSRVIEEDGKPIYFQTSGITALSLRDRELVGHGINYHSQGFGSPVGSLKGINMAIEDMSPRDLMAYNIYEGKTARIEFEGGVVVQGEVITGKRNLQGKIVLISFKDCTVRRGDEVLFAPEWGVYDMSVGKSVVSAFSGPADPKSFDMINHIPAEKTISVKKTDERLALEAFYQQVRDQRNGKASDLRLENIFSALKQDHAQDWLLALEMYELVNQDDPLFDELKNYLIRKAEQLHEVSHLIKSGMTLAESSHNRIEV